MRIEGSGSFWEYRLQEVSWPEAVQKTQGQQPEPVEVTVPQADDSQQLITADGLKPQSGMQDISIEYQAESSFDFTGKDSDIQSLDVQQAISDMRRDRVLEEYQYFVGNQGIDSVEGTVFQK